MPQISGKLAKFYAFLILTLTILFCYFFSSYEVIVGGSLVTVFFTVFIKGNNSTVFAGIAGIFIMTIMVIYLNNEIPVIEILTEHVFSLLLVIFTILMVIYLKHLQQHLAFDKTHMASLYENTAEGILLTNNMGEIILANPSAQKMFGYTEEEMSGNRVEMLLPENVRAKHEGYRDGFYQHPQNRTMGSGRDLNARHKLGHVFPVEISLSHYRKDNKIFVIAFIVDISQRKEIEENLIRKQKELEKVTNDIRKLNTQLEMKVEERTQILSEALLKLEQSQKELHEALDKERELNEIKSRFLSMASHEFRTPLSTVLSSASLLSKYTTAEDQVKRDRHIEKIKSSVKNLNDILEDFLSLGKLDEGKIEADISEFDLKELVEETSEEIGGLLKNGQSFQISYEGERLICSDKKLLKNILINLISNASKFSDEGTPIEIQGLVKNGFVEISVTDHGIGISEADQAHLFSSFFRAANAANIQGTGLGLHIVKRYSDLLNGKVALQSRLNEGTTILITIPVKEINL